MKILICWPPHVPSYFNAGHHLPVFSVAAYLRNLGYRVDALDAGAMNCNWKEFGAYLYQGCYNLIVLFNDFDSVEGLGRAADYARALLPNAVIMTVGRLSNQNPEFFQRFCLDAIATSGDYESATQEVVRWINEGSGTGHGLAGVVIRTESGWAMPSRTGHRLTPDDWVFPDIREIPYSDYEKLYANDQNKFCGIPGRRELVVPIARGCPIACDFCDVPTMQGLHERRVNVERVVDYICHSFSAGPFEYVSFYAPTFTLNEDWVIQLCQAMLKKGLHYPWKCSTTLYHLNEALIKEMAATRCVRISIGIETLEDGAAEHLPMAKRSALARFNAVAGWCREKGIELNCFVIVGLPGTTVAGTRKTIALIESAGARIRPTLYTPYHQMHGAMSEREVSGFNRHLFVDSALWEADEEHDALGLIFAGDDYVTPATQQIPKAKERPRSRNNAS